ncbi:DUF5937 family protein [Streptomyces sp. Y2F8-2]|uniref:DUF5937 family protein n=1 Tax=Streptomyces sp. Y2F8-2 TaxID=2759675 RepID=UPI0035B55C0D
MAVGLSPLAELMACLHSMAEPEHHLDVRPWLERVSAELSAESKSLLAVYAPLWNRRRCRVLLPLCRRSPATSGDCARPACSPPGGTVD